MDGGQANPDVMTAPVVSDTTRSLSHSLGVWLDTCRSRTARAYTAFRKKHFGISWSILILFVPKETEMNRLLYSLFIQLHDDIINASHCT